MSAFDNYSLYQTLYVDNIMSILKQVDHVYYPDSLEEKVLAIILEESEAYFAGEKKLAETVDMIESRATMLVNEQID